MSPEEPQIELSQDGISRRRMLKRIGAGAAVAWSAPILTSIRTPAFAQNYGCSPCSACFDGSTPCGDNCFCSEDVNGDCFCAFNGPCAGQSNCTTNDDCPGGRCMSVACLGCGGPGVGTQCLDPCGGNQGQVRGLRAASPRR
jgi:hypothetical protein